MRRKTRFIDKVKMALMYVFDSKENAYLLVCDNCNSSDLKQVTKRKLITSVEYGYRCNKCGATCIDIQNWKFKEDSDANNQSE